MNVKTYYIVSVVSGPYDSVTHSSETFTSWNYAMKYAHRMLLMSKSLKIDRRVQCV